MHAQSVEQKGWDDEDDFPRGALSFIGLGLAVLLLWVLELPGIIKDTFRRRRR
jgi:hypothetical protein